MVGLVLLTAMLTGAVTEAEYIDGGLLQKIFFGGVFFSHIYTTHLFLVHFQILALQSPLPVAKIPSVPFEFRDTATEMTELRWPCNINNGLPEAWSQKMTPRSLSPTKCTRCRGTADRQNKVLVANVGYLAGRLLSDLPSKCHNLTVLSKDPEAICSPLLEKATE